MRLVLCKERQQHGVIHLALSAGALFQLTILHAEVLCVNSNDIRPAQVDEVTDDNLKLSMRNKNGELVAVGQAKEVVEDTGYNRGWLFLIAGAAILASAGGAYFVIRTSFGKEESGV